MRLAALVSIVFLVLTCLLLAQENLPPGRYLSDGIYQPRNQKAASYGRASRGEPANPFLPLTSWGEDIRVTNFPYPHAHNSVIAASENHVYIAWWYLTGDTIFLAQSHDGGSTWVDRKLSDDSTTRAVVPKISASDSNIYVTYRAARPWYGCYLQRSTDFGASWLPTRRLYYTLGENFAESPVVASWDSMVYVAADIKVNYVPPNQDWDMWLFRSPDFGESWPDTFFISDSTTSGMGADLMAGGCGLHVIRGLGLPSSSVMEVIYSGSHDLGESWFGPTMISDNDTSGSFWPQVAAWGDSDVVVSWTDYKDSQQEWTGDAFVSRSTDGGLSWSEPFQLTRFHGVQGTDVSARGDTVAVCFDDHRSGTSAIYAALSFDGGETWQEDLRVSDSPHYCIESSVALSGGFAHVSWSDSRNNPDPRYFEIYYDRGSVSTDVVVDGGGPAKPEGIALSAYPNPFNSSTTVTLSGKDDAEIAIYDITGRRLDILQTINGRAVWEASAFSSGVYFARVAGERSGNVLRLVVVR